MQSTIRLLIVFYGLFILTSAQITFTDLDTTLRNELQTAIDQSRGNREFLASIVRLIFHDCAGQEEGNFDGFGGSICDGCIDYNNEDHAGLQALAINGLENIYLSSPNNWRGRGLSRSDFWAAAATIAVQYAKELDPAVNDILPDIPFYIGRQDCSSSPDASITALNYKLPYKSFPNPKSGWDDTLLWFENNFNFDITETVAIIGAHTLGRLHAEFSGYGTVRGLAWVGGQDQLNNAFFRDLVRRDFVQQLNAQGLYEWVNTINEQRIFLNADIALFKYIDDNIININNGQVSCAFSSCSINDVASSIALLYANNNQQWLTDFANAFNKMIQMGYDNLQILTENNNNNGITPNPTDPPVFVPPPTAVPTRRRRRRNRP